MPAKIRTAVYALDKVLPFIPPASVWGPADTVKDFDGDMIELNHLRYRVFVVKGLTCQQCGLRGSFFAKETFECERPRYHLGLYAVDPVTGADVLMTLHHIVPKSQGGKETLFNLIPLCERCNSKVSIPKSGDAVETHT